MLAKGKIPRDHIKRMKTNTIKEITKGKMICCDAHTWCVRVWTAWKLNLTVFKALSWASPWDVHDITCIQPKNSTDWQLCNSHLLKDNLTATFSEAILWIWFRFSWHIHFLFVCNLFFDGISSWDYLHFNGVPLFCFEYLVVCIRISMS